jgi:hypothetical protein
MMSAAHANGFFIVGALMVAPEAQTRHARAS